MNRVEIFAREELLPQTQTPNVMRTIVAEGVIYNAMLTPGNLTELVVKRLIKIGQAERGGATTRSGLLDWYREAVQRLQEYLAPMSSRFRQSYRGTFTKH
jgi:hypothetical protein